MGSKRKDEGVIKNTHLLLNSDGGEKSRDILDTLHDQESGAFLPYTL